MDKDCKGQYVRAAIDIARITGGFVTGDKIPTADEIVDLVAGIAKKLEQRMEAPQAKEEPPKEKRKIDEYAREGKEEEVKGKVVISVSDGRKNTYPSKEMFKELGFVWDAEKKAWTQEADRAKATALKKRLGEDFKVEGI